MCEFTAVLAEAFTDTNLKRIDDTVQKLDDEQRRNLTLDHSHEVDAMSEHVDEVVVRRGDHRRNVLRLAGALLRLEEVITHWAAHHALPVLLQEDISRGVHQEQTVDHLQQGCCLRSGQWSNVRNWRTVTQHTQTWYCTREPVYRLLLYWVPERTIFGAGTDSAVKVSEKLISYKAQNSIHGHVHTAGSLKWAIRVKPKRPKWKLFCFTWPQ